MGNDCVGCTPNQKYRRYFEEIKVSELKDLWQTVKVYKIKKIFDGAAENNPNYNHHTYLPYQKFKTIFPEMEHYPEQQVRRIFQFFDFESEGFVDWGSFFSAITVCYFCSERVLALIMFMMYDLSLDFKLDHNYLTLMIENNENYLRMTESGDFIDCEMVVDKLKEEPQFTIERWLQVYPTYFQMSKFRKVFNLFQEEKMEKELVKYFHEWNVIFNEDRQKYIGYLINLKWFQTWTLYINHHYGIQIDIYNPVKAHFDTVKTCKKTNRTLKTVTKSEMDSSRALHGCRKMQISRDKKKQISIKDIDCIHGNLGERPLEITNSQLQGEYEQILRNEVSENMDYVIVAEKVWNHLHLIYGGYPQFRRTGFDAIELYPKIIRTYLSLFKGCIDYSSQVRREVSSYLRVDQLLTKSCDVKEEELEEKVVFFKTIKMKRWQLLQDLSFLFTELTSEVLIFLVCLPKSEKETFKKFHQKMPRDVTEINLGESLMHVNSRGEEESAIFMGKTTEGKYVLHLEGKSYTNDICLIESELLKQCRISAKLVQVQPQKRMIHCGLVGLPCGSGLGFINSTFLQIFNNKEMCNFLKMLDISLCNDKLLYYLASLNNMLVKQLKIESSDIKVIVDLFLSKYIEFEVTMCPSFIEDVMEEIVNEMKADEFPDIISKNYQVMVEKNVHCLHCNSKSVSNEQSYFYKVFVPEDEYYYFEVVWVPVDATSADILRYLIKIKKGSTLGAFMTEIENEMEIKEKSYVLTEVKGNDIVKNFNSVSKTATLETLKIRQSDKYYVYELTTDFNNFVSKHFSSKQSVDENSLKKDQFIDCKHEEKGWIFGKIIQIDFLPYTQTSLVRVVHKFNKNESWQISYDVSDGDLARYPLRSHKNCEQYHLRVQQRCFNEASNTMQLINIPLVIAMPSWMRWKEFTFFIYQQIRKFIAEEYGFSYDIDNHQMQTSRSMKKINENPMVEKFKEYRASEKFPYNVNLCDFEGRCIVCYKFLKSVVFKGENDSYCEGCKISQTEPISWQIKPADLMVCIDWRGPERFREDIIINTSEIEKKTTQRKKEELLLQNILKASYGQRVQEQQFLCCNTLAEKKVTQKVSSGQNFVIYIERVVKEVDGFKKVLDRPVKIVLDGLVVDKKKYGLVGMTSIEGENFNIKYKTYTRKDKNTWFEYDNQIVREVSSGYLQKQCALTLYYQLQK